MKFIEVEKHLQVKLIGGEFKLLDRAAFKRAYKSIRSDDIYICVLEAVDNSDDFQMGLIQTVFDLLIKGIRPLVVVIYEQQINTLDLFVNWLNQKALYSVFHLLHVDFLDLDYIQSILKDKSNAIDFSNFILADSNIRDATLVDDLEDCLDELQEGLDEGDSRAEKEKFINLFERSMNVITEQEATVSRVHAIEDKSIELEKVTLLLQESNNKLQGIEASYETRLRDAAASQLTGESGATIGNFVRFNTNTLKFKGRMVYFKCLDNLIYFKTLIAAFNDHLKTPTNTGRAANAVHSRIVILDYWRPSLKLEYGECEIITAKNYSAERDRVQRGVKPIVLTTVNHVILRSICEDQYAKGDGILLFVDYLGYPDTLFMYNPNEFFVASSIGLIDRYEKELDIEIAANKIITRAFPNDPRYVGTIGLPQIRDVSGMRLRERLVKVKGMPNMNSSKKDSKVIEELTASIKEGR